MKNNRHTFFKGAPAPVIAAEEAHDEIIASDAYTRDGATMVFDNVSTVRQGLEADGLRLIAKS